MMIRQSHGETQTLTRRDTQMSNRLRQIEANLENYSREEIREIYDSVRESQMRLFLMRGQIEQLEHRRRTLEAYTKQIQQMMALTQSLAARPEPPPPAATRPTSEPVSQTAQQTIVRIIDAQEKERRALARQMHDGPATSLSNLVLQAEVVERLFTLDPDQARNELGVLKVAVNSTFQRTRDFIFNLRPMMLDDLGLFPTLRQVRSGVSKQDQDHYRVNHYGPRPAPARAHRGYHFQGDSGAPEQYPAACQRQPCADQR